LTALEAGRAVTVAPLNQKLTTQQAADILGVSRPTVVKLIERGELPAETPGARRRLVSLEDVLDCRARRREAQYRALMETSVDDYGAEPEGAELALEELRRIRAEVAAERAQLRS
jgi:excisionase family DNA binding protein